MSTPCWRARVVAATRNEWTQTAGSRPSAVTYRRTRYSTARVVRGFRLNPSRPNPRGSGRAGTTARRGRRGCRRRRARRRGVRGPRGVILLCQLSQDLLQLRLTSIGLSECDLLLRLSENAIQNDEGLCRILI